MKACSEAGLAVQGDIVTNDEIMLSLSEGLLAWKNLEPMLAEIQRSKVISVSPHSSKAIDYLIKSEGNGDFYSYYLSGENSFPLCLNMKSPEILVKVSRTAKEFVFFADRLEKTDKASLVIDTLDRGDIEEHGGTDKLTT